MAAKRLSRIVQAFMAKWLFLPAIVGLLVGSAVWIRIEAQAIQNEQERYARTVAEHVNTYLKQSRRYLNFFALLVEEKGFGVDHLRSFPRYSSTVRTVYLLNASKEIVDAAPKEAQKTGIHEVVHSASVRDGLYLTSAYTSKFHDKIVVGLARPASGDRMLLAELDLRSLQSSLQKLTYQMEGGTAFVTDASGNLLAHPNMSLVHRQINLEQIEPLAKLQKGETVSGFQQRKGAIHFISATNVRFGDWKVGVERKALPLFAHTLWIIGLSLTALMALFGTAAFLFHRRLRSMVIHPLSRFTDELDALEHGNDSPNKDPEDRITGMGSCSELWTLWQHFSYMREAVRQREAALRANEEDLRTTLQSIGDGVVVTDEHGRITRMNPAATELTGWDLEGARGQDLFEVLKLVNTQTGDVCDNPVHTVISTGRSQELANHTALIDREGRKYQIADSASPIRDDEGNITGVVFVFRDVTEKYRQEEALRESERTMQTLLSNLPGLAYRCANEPDWPMEFVSRGCEELLEYTPEELVSRDAREYGQLIHPEDAPRVDREVQEALSQGSAFELEYRIRTKSGEERWVWEKGRAVGRDAHGRQILEGFVTDITEYKEFQEKLNFLSFHDTLTGLYNRNFFEEEMSRLGDGRYSPVGIIVCDLDGLKFVNDTLGHQSGDTMLVDIARLLQTIFRSSDIVARIGGDEFAVLLTHSSHKITEYLARRLRRSVEEYNRNDPWIPLSLSIGYAVSERGTTDMQALFREADNRMYREKIQREGSARSAAVHALTRALEARDFITEGHSERLQHLMAAMARALNMSEEKVNDLILLAQFHDLGKVGVPDRILFKPGPLTEEEMEEMQKHCEIGHRIAHSVSDLAPIAEWILSHHEWWDGRGYPRGLKGEEIPLPCRILAIADAYDTMTSERPYKEAVSADAAIQELRRCAGTQFDPVLVEQFVAILHDFRAGHDDA